MAGWNCTTEASEDRVGHPGFLHVDSCPPAAGPLVSHRNSVTQTPGELPNMDLGFRASVLSSMRWACVWAHTKASLCTRAHVVIRWPLGPRDEPLSRRTLAMSETKS